MGFGLALGCPEGHSALLQLQESEVRLLEGLRKWMGQRAKSDREYAALLHQMHSLAGKREGGRQPRLAGQIGQVGSPGRDLGLPRPAPLRCVRSGLLAGRAASGASEMPAEGRGSWVAQESGRRVTNRSRGFLRFSIGALTFAGPFQRDRARSPLLKEPVAPAWSQVDLTIKMHLKNP